MDVTIVIAEGFPLIRTGLRAVLSTEPGFRVLGEADDGEVALELAEVLKPDVLLANVKLPNTSGFEVARELMRRKSPVQVLLVSTSLLPVSTADALQSGARGCIDLDCSRHELIAAIRSAAPIDQPTSTLVPG